MPSLSANFESLASTFATNVLALARRASVNEINEGAPVTREAEGRPPSADVSSATASPSLDVRRMSADTIDSVATLITRYVKSHQGAKAVAIRKELGIPATKWARPSAFALKKKGLSKKGQKRATTYWVK
jgi:hypothetical protein